MRPDTFGPDAVIADREEDYRLARIRSGEASITRDCAVCGRLVPNSGPDLCADHLLVPCAVCHGHRRIAKVERPYFRQDWEWCADCGGEGLVSFSYADAMGWPVSRGGCEIEVTR